MKHGLASAIALFASIALTASGPVAADGQRCLNDLERQVAQDHPGVHALTVDQFEDRLRKGDQIVVFDVRESKEFAVSRLPGAVNVEPGITAEEFLRRHGREIAGKTVLLYCSVGVRSSRLASRIDGAVREAGAEGAYNLRGGVFSWHNTGRKLVDATGETDKVDGYDRTWSRYIDFDNLVRLTRRWFW